MTEFLIRIFVRKNKTGSGSLRKRYGMLSGICGLVLGLLLFGFKLTAGLISGSVSVIGDALNNLSDAGSSIVTVMGFSLSSRPASKKHPFGHGRVEYLTGFAVGFIIIFMGAELLKEGVTSIFSPKAAQLTEFTAAVLIGSALVKLWMYFFNRRLYRETNSTAIKASCADSLSDVLATLAVLLGLTAQSVWGLPLDGYLAAAVALFIIWSGISAARETMYELVGGRPDPVLMESISETVLSHGGIVGIHDLILHNYGPDRRMVSLHAEVDECSDIIKIHEIVDHIEFEIKEKFNCDATIHVDPIVTEDTHVIRLRQKIADILRGLHTGITLHDFRIVESTTHTKLIFDVVLPFKCGITDTDAKRKIRSAVEKLDSKYIAVVRIERPFA